MTLRQKKKKIYIKAQKQLTCFASMWKATKQKQNKQQKKKTTPKL